MRYRPTRLIAPPPAASAGSWRSFPRRSPSPPARSFATSPVPEATVSQQFRKLTLGPEEELSPGLGALLRGFREAAHQGGDARAYARGALDEIGRLPEDLLSSRPAEAADGSPVTSVTPMLSAASTVIVPGLDSVGPPSEPIEARLLRGLSAIEHAAGASSSAARSAALSILAERDAAQEAPIQIEPPAMTSRLSTRISPRSRASSRRCATQLAF